jgi:hypothetical protein
MDSAVHLSFQCQWLDPLQACSVHLIPRFGPVTLVHTTALFTPVSYSILCGAMNRGAGNAA